MSLDGSLSCSEISALGTEEMMDSAPSESDSDELLSLTSTSLHEI